MPISSFIFGELDGVPVPGFVLANNSGLRAKVMAYGARLTEMHIPDRDGRFADVVLGFTDIDSYVASDTFFGATCGRYGNRIARGRFTFNGHNYQLDLNDGPNHLHGGTNGFDRRMFAAAMETATNSVVFTRVSADGEEGYPGEMNIAVRYQLTDDNVLDITMSATTTAATVVGMVHHTYWNLSGHDTGSIRDQRLQLNAPFYTPFDNTLIPTGAIVSTVGTPYDMTRVRNLGDVINAIAGIGFDNNFCLGGEPGQMRTVARLDDPTSGRVLDVAANQPGLQVYSAGRFPNSGIVGKAGARYTPFSGIALETQTFPNSPNVSHFPLTRLDPGQLYEHRLRFHFSA